MAGTAAYEQPVAPAKRLDVVRNRSLLALAVGHLTVDRYVVCCR